MELKSLNTGRQSPSCCAFKTAIYVFGGKNRYFGPIDSMEYLEIKQEPYYKNLIRQKWRTIDLNGDAKPCNHFEAVISACPVSSTEILILGS